jgi:hypothetical protein
MATPPPPPPPPPSRVAQVGIPSKCYPNIEALMLFQQNQSVFDKSERKALSDTDVGRRFARVLYNCRSHRETYLSSREHYEKDKTSQDSKRKLAADGMQLQSCLVARVCPQRWQRFGECWSHMPPELVQEFQQAGMAHYLCRSERQAIERCVGDFVSQSTRQATADEAEFTDDLMAIA